MKRLFVVMMLNLSAISKPHYRIRRVSDRLILEYVSEGSVIRYASCNKYLEPYVRLLTSGSNELADLLRVMKVYIAMKVLPYCKGREDLIIDVIREMSESEVLFWYIKLSKFGRKAVSAFKKLYL